MNNLTWVIAAYGDEDFRNEMRKIISLQHNGVVKRINTNHQLHAEWNHLRNNIPTNPILYVFTDASHLKIDNFVFQYRHVNIRVLILGDRSTISPGIRKNSTRVYYQNLYEMPISDRNDCNQPWVRNRNLCICRNQLSGVWSLYDFEDEHMVKPVE